MPTKIDLKTKLKPFYMTTVRQFEMVEVPPLQFLMLDGQGDPNHAPLYQQSVEALYAVAYKIKFASKENPGTDYTVMPLEGLWWVEDMTKFSIEHKSDWLWTMMIMQPEWVNAAMFDDARQKVAKKIAADLLGRMRLETYHEGLSVQVLHIGSYADEAPTLRRLHGEYIPQNGLEPAGKHHEIYLSDPRKSAPEKWKTILRQPVRKASC